MLQKNVILHLIILSAISSFLTKYKQLIISEINTYYSNGKLLLTGEYLVLDGALGLGVPTKKGQNLVVQPIEGSKIYWKSIADNGEIWFNETFDLPLKPNQYKNSIAQTLVKVLTEAQLLNADFLKENSGYNITTNLNFARDWGLGSSSTLLNNIANWANVDAFQLLQKTMGGSGYDIACAQYDKPILYQLHNQKPQITPVDFNPVFKEQLYFVHLDKKQRSAKEITRYQNIKRGIPEAVKTVSEITDLLTKTTTIEDFSILIREHERLLSSVLKTPTVQETRFKDYFGQTKSLGAWGGDFILATGNDDTPKYFKQKGFNTVLLYAEMIL